MLMPWLDELVDLSIDGRRPAGSAVLQARHVAVVAVADLRELPGSSPRQVLPVVISTAHQRGAGQVRLAGLSAAPLGGGRYRDFLLLTACLACGEAGSIVGTRAEVAYGLRQSCTAAFGCRVLRVGAVTGETFRLATRVRWPWCPPHACATASGGQKPSVRAYADARIGGRPPTPWP